MTADLHVVPATETSAPAPQDLPDTPERFPHAMVDAESMASHTSRALLLSIALVPFALEPTGPRFGAPTLIIPELGAQMLSGRLVTPDTQAFWARQKPAASEHWLGVPPTHAPNQLRGALTDWIATNTIRDAQLWARGQAFDFGNLDNIMDVTPGRAPWWFPNLRDQRTQVAFNPKLRSRPTDLVIAAAPHDPVHDCMVQAWALWERAPAEAIGLPANPVRDPARLVVESPPVSLVDCPPGLFRFNSTLGFRSEYGDDAFVVESGEAFWGGESNRAKRNALLVIPLALQAPFGEGVAP